MIYKDSTLLNLILNNQFSKIASNTELSPLHIASLQNDLSAAINFLENGGNSNIQDTFGVTPIYYAAQMGNIEMLTLLIDYGADINAYTINTDDTISKIVSGSTPLVCAIESGLTEPVLILLNAGACVNQPINEYGWTALHATLAFPKNNFLEIVELLMARGADPYIKIYNGENAFEIANRWGDNLGLQHLLHDTHFIANHDFSHFNEAIQMKDLDMLEFLIENGTDLNVQAPINGYDFMAGYTPLMCAIQNNSIESVAILLNHGAFINELTDVDGSTALHVAVAMSRENTLDILELLMSHGADPYLKNAQGEDVFNLLDYWRVDNQAVKEVLNHTNDSAIGFDEVLLIDTLDAVDLLDYSNPYGPSLDLDQVFMLHNTSLDTSDFPDIQPMGCLLHFELNISM